jgi:ATP-dependent DNA helicase DinG
MAEEVAAALADRRALLVEAGTGTGKTLAYLVPAILSGLKVVVSTGTKNLQEQIYKKDVPLLQAELDRPFSAACMKGLSNYLCLRRFDEHSRRQAVLPGLGDPMLEAVRRWASETESGDRAEMPELADDAPVWREVSATVETRLGTRCPHFESCFVTRARRRAQAADLVIVNHHLFFADLALKTAWPQAQLLPPYEAVIFDEAHQLEDVVTDFFGITVSTLRLSALTRDAARVANGGGRRPRIAQVIDHVEAKVAGLFDRVREKLPRGERVQVGRELWVGDPEKAAHALDNSLSELEAALGGAALDEGADDEAGALARRARAVRDDLALLVDGAQKHDRRHVFWAEQRGATVLLHASPIDVADLLRQHLHAQIEPLVFTSATLAAGGSFEFVRTRLGLEAAAEARLASPFDYGSQALLYLPNDLPEPGDDRFAQAAAARIEALVGFSRGRAFLLFTSHKQLRRVHALLTDRLRHPLLVQGDQPKHVLLDAFKARPGSVLFGTASFWEGVDVVGDALSLVVIDKLPFQPPDDPLVAARAARLEDEGQDPFQRYHVPRAALQLAQGFGRLIRHRGDRGVVALLDCRASTRSYGRRVLGGLPADCPRTSSLEEVGRFFGVAGAEARA